MGKRLTNLTKRLSWTLAALSVFAWQFMTPVMASASVDPKPQDEPKVTICHRTSSYSNPYVEIEVAQSAVDGQASNSGNEPDHYGEHQGPIFYSSIPKHTEWGDIIPPVSPYHNGWNYTTEGQAILRNHCKFPNTGKIQVRKKVDLGNGYVDDNPSQYGFKWGLDGDDPTNEMGSKLEGVVADDHSITENSITGYTFSGWYYTYKTESNSCTKPVGTTLPISTKVKKDDTTYITLCNKKVVQPKGTIEVKKDLVPSSDSGRFNLKIDSDVKKYNAGDNDTTGKVTVDAGDHSVGEIAANGSTKLSDYDTTIVCKDKSNWQTVASGSSTDSDYRKLSVSVAKDHDILCVITNTRHATLRIVKKAQPHNNKSFKFESKVLGDFYLTDNGYSANYKDFAVETGKEIKVEEDHTHGWDLKYAYCSGVKDWEHDDHGSKIEVKLAPGENAVCTFTNVKLGEVEGYKFDDKNSNGVRDEGESKLKGWTINLYKVCKEQNDELSFTTLSAPKVFEEHKCEDKPFKTTVTNYKGEYKFDDLKEGFYKVCEVQQSYWTQTYPSDNNGCHIIKICEPGQEVHANFGNHHNVELNIEKSNDTTGPVMDGTIVTYTIKVSVPLDSDTVYDAKVVDVLPAGFEYVSGSTTGAGEPTIDDQQQIWNAGTINPGESVTLTYKAKVTTAVTPGKYTNFAFAQGFETEGCIDQENPQLDNQLSTRGYEYECERKCDVVNSDLVSSDVTVIAPQVLGAYTAGHVLGAELVNTGEPLMMIQFALPSIMLLITALIGASSKRDSKKGAK